MHIANKLQTLGMAAVVTLGLVLGMYSLTYMKEPLLEQLNAPGLPIFKQSAEDASVVVIVAPPSKPVESELPSVVAPIDRKMDLIIDSNIGDGSDFVQYVTGDGIGLGSDVNELPLFRAAPMYPRVAAAQGLCGWVELAFTVGVDGSARDAVVTASSSSMFESSAVKAANKYKYRPKHIGGKAVATKNVPVRIVFEMEEGC